MFDPGDDFPAVVDVLEAVTLERADGSPSTLVSAALRRFDRRFEAAPSEGVYQAAHAVWHLPAADLAQAPRPGDTVLDSLQRRWTIRAVEQTAAGTRWRVQTEAIGLDPARQDTLEVLQPVYTRTESGAEVATWQTVATGLAARIQPVAEQVHTAAGRQWTAARVTIYLAQPAAVDAGCRLRDAQGRVYSIVQIRRASRNDALLEIDAQRQP